MLLIKAINGVIIIEWKGWVPGCSKTWLLDININFETIATNSNGSKNIIYNLLKEQNKVLKA